MPLSEESAKQKLEYARSLLHQVVYNDLNVEEVNVSAAREVLRDALGALDQVIDYAPSVKPRDGLTPQKTTKKKTKTFSSKRAAAKSSETGEVE